MILFSLVLCISAIAVPVSAGTVHTGNSASVDVVVVFENHVDESLIRQYGGQITGGHSVSTLPVRFARMPADHIDDLAETTPVKTVERDYTVRTGDSQAETTRTNTNDTQSVPWGVKTVDSRNASVSAAAQRAVDVAVVDTGIDDDHPDLADTVVWGANTVGAGEVAYGLQSADDDNGHGTHVAGVVGAANNSDGVVGVAPAVDLYAMKALDRAGRGTISDVIQAVDVAIAGPDGTYGTADDADVVLLSLGTDRDSNALRSAITSATDRAYLVAAAGNSGDGNVETNDLLYPAKYPGVLAVGASTKNSTVPVWSPSGEELDLVAPGVDIYSTVPEGQYRELTGTSMAAPHAAGSAALVIAADARDGRRDLRRRAVTALLTDTAVRVDQSRDDRVTGGGIVNAAAAVRSDPVPLTVSVDGRPFVVGSPLTVRVTRGDTGEPVNATVSIGEIVRSTGDNGTISYLPNQSGRVTVRATRAGSNRTVYIDAIQGINISAQGPVVVGDDPATNLDTDAVFEDVNGNGIFDIGDIQALFVYSRDSDASSNVSAFDVNENGRLDIGDIVALYHEYRQVASGEA